MNPNRPTPRYTITKMAKIKDTKRILKAAREKQRVNYKGLLPLQGCQLISLSTETLKARREWQDIFTQSLKRE